MFIVDDNIIKINRGDAGTLNLVIPLSEDENYEFDVGDKIQFRIFEKKGYDKNIVLEKEIEITEQCENVLISLSEEDTTFGDDINKPVTYWYEIDLNNEQTIIGYSEEGPAELILYPAKGVESNA